MQLLRHAQQARLHKSKWLLTLLAKPQSEVIAEEAIAAAEAVPLTGGTVTPPAAAPRTPAPAGEEGPAAKRRRSEGPPMDDDIAERRTGIAWTVGWCTEHKQVWRRPRDGGATEWAEVKNWIPKRT